MNRDPSQIPKPSAQKLDELSVAMTEGQDLLRLHQRLIEYDPFAIHDLRWEIMIGNLEKTDAADILGAALREAINQEVLRLGNDKPDPHLFHTLIIDVDRLVTEFDCKPVFLDRAPITRMLEVLDSWMTDRSRSRRTLDGRNLALRALNLVGVDQNVVQELREDERAMLARVAAQAFAQAIINGDFLSAGTLGNFFHKGDNQHERRVAAAVPEMLIAEYRGVNEPRSYIYREIDRLESNQRLAFNTKFRKADYTAIGVPFDLGQIRTALRTIFHEETKEPGVPPSPKFLDFASRFELSNDFIAKQFFRWIENQSPELQAQHPATVAHWVDALKLTAPEYLDRLPLVGKAIEFVSLNLAEMDPNHLNSANLRDRSEPTPERNSLLASVPDTEAAFVARNYSLNAAEERQAAIGAIRICCGKILIDQRDENTNFARISALGSFLKLPARVDCPTFTAELKRPELPGEDFLTGTGGVNLSLGKGPQLLNRGAERTKEILYWIGKLKSKGFEIDLTECKSALVTRIGALFAREILRGSFPASLAEIEKFTVQAGNLFELSSGELFNAARYAATLVMYYCSELVEHEQPHHKTIREGRRLGEIRSLLSSLERRFRVPQCGNGGDLEEIIDQLGFEL